MIFIDFLFVGGGATLPLKDPRQWGPHCATSDTNSAHNVEANRETLCQYLNVTFNCNILLVYNWFLFDSFTVLPMIMMPGKMIIPPLKMLRPNAVHNLSIPRHWTITTTVRAVMPPIPNP